MGAHNSPSQQQQCSFSDHTLSPAPVPESSSRRRSSGDPIRLLVLLHKAVKVELEDLRRVAINAAAIGAESRKLAVVELRRRLAFLRSVYAYHCAAEDEVIFLALDGRVENIVCTYHLEHSSIDGAFQFIFSCLNVLPEDQDNASQEFQELIFHTGSLCDLICQHMYKEEKQVFPLLMKQFSDDEQASLVWQYICCVPVMLMEDLFPWLSRLLTPDEQLDLKHCVMRIVPQDTSLQGVVISWLEKTTREPPDPGGFVEFDISQFPHNPDTFEDLYNFYLTNSFSSKNFLLEQDLQINIKDGRFNGLSLWHAAIRSEIKEISDKLYLIRSKNSLKLTSVIVRINFLTDVLIFYSNALERVCYPSLEESSVLLLSPSFKSFPHKNEVQALQQILCDANQNKLANSRFVETLCSKVEALVMATCEHLSFLETEVFPLICKESNHSTQQKLIVRSLRMLPLGFLKCLAIWFSSRLPKDELRPLLNALDQPGLLDKSFASLLHEWMRMGYSGKSTTEDLQEMFNSRLSYMSEQIREDRDPRKKSKHVSSRHCSATSSSRISLSSTLSKQCQPTGKHGMCSVVVNSPLLPSKESNMVHSFSGCLEAVVINYPEAKPIDHIYYFHKALKKDLDSLIRKTTKLSENMGLLVEFSQHFHLVRSLYALHSETEDEIAFPALEAKQEARNLTQSYSIDHKLEDGYFDRVSRILDEMSELNQTVLGAHVDPKNPALIKYHQLCFKLQDSCKSLKMILNDHIHHEEMELWPLFREYFTTEEQEKIIGYMLGRTRAEILQKMIVWLMNSLTSEEQHAMMNFWRKATRFTMFDEWLGEWWEGVNICDSAKTEDSNNSPSCATDSMEAISKYLSVSSVHDGGESVDDKCVNAPCNDLKATKIINKTESLDEDNQKHKSSEYSRLLSEKEGKHHKEENLVDLADKSSQLSQLSHIIRHGNKVLVTSQLELEAAIRRVSQDSSLDLQEKSRVIQNLMTSHWVAAQQLLDEDNVITSEPGKLPCQHPSYRDIEGSVFGCKHYKQNCKVVAACCNQLFTCRRCHDEVADHLMDRKATTQMMCMKCLEIQPIGPTCSTPSCNKYPMARYYCRICRLFDDEREIYHCPYCNLCRVGKGLGIDYFHCMKCNACMSRSLSVHLCREKCFEDKCPICHEDIFTSSIPIKALACGHLMHSTCFQDYTLMHYTCPVCSKSLGNMQVYFEMLDALLAEEKMPDEFSGQTQAILCNDCERKGTAPFHWLYHKCPFCCSYNTRLL